MSPASFEDKRKENWDKGQQELQKRRASLLEQQNRDAENRKKKEKEEAEQREKQKAEVERRRLAELDRQRQRLLQEEEQRRQIQEQRELARKEMEKQRLEEWEKQRTNELEQHRQRETEKVLNLRAKKETLNTEQEKLKDLMTDLSTKITDTRTGVTDVKAFIDGMRTSRDTKMAELNALKNQLKEQNQRLMQVTQEKAKLESKNRVNQKKITEGKALEYTDFDLKKDEKKAKVEELRIQLDTLKTEEFTKKNQVETNKQLLSDHREKLKQMIVACKALHEGFDEKRRDVRAEKKKKIHELTDPNHAWESEFAAPEPEPEPVAVEVFSQPEPAAEPVAEPAEPVASVAAVAGAAVGGYDQYRALYDYEARNEDELSFAINDIILVHPEQEHEPGWLGGELAGKIGWFPEAYAQKLGEVEQTTLQPIAEVSETGSDNGSFQDSGNGFPEPSAVVEPEAAAVEPAVEPVPAPAAAEPSVQPIAVSAAAAEPETDGTSAQYVSIYAYSSEEPDDLQFDVGVTIVVSRKDGDWWTGSIGDRTGVFPYNYVEPLPEEGAVTETTENDVSEISEVEDKSGKKMEIAKVIAPYEGTSKEQLTLALGQMVLVRKKTETGWWQGELQAGGKGKKRAVGWFPASYVKLLDGGADKKPTPAGTESAGEKFLAQFDYAAQYEDELSFSAGDTVLVTKKDEADWWFGKVGDKEGVFPSNYVAPPQ